MHATEQGGRRRQRHVALGPRRVGRDRDVARDEREPLATVTIDADRLTGGLKALIAEKAEERMDRRRVHARRSQHVVAIAHHGSSVGDPAVEHFDVGHAGEVTDRSPSPMREVKPGPGRA